MNNSQLAHIWANQSKDDGKGSGFFFERDTIYSFGHHFPIARHIDKGTVLYTIKTYGSYTGRHLNHTWSALHGMDKQIFNVPDVMADTKNEHKENYQSYMRRIREALDKASRARKYKISYYEDAHKLTVEANRYTKKFKLGYRQLSENLDDVTEYHKRAIEEANKRKEAERRRDVKKATEQLKKWRETGLNRLSLTPLGKDFLRVKDEKTIETSRGAEFPVEHAKKAWKLIDRLNGADWHSNGHTIKLGYYSVDRIVNGVIYAGCHSVDISEAARIAEQLKF